MLASGDGAVRAESGVRISGGDIDVTTSYEGVEGVSISVDDDTVHITSADDGINGVSGTADAATVTGGRGPGGESGDSRLLINGGYIVVDAGGTGQTSTARSR